MIMITNKRGHKTIQKYIAIQNLISANILAYQNGENYPS